MSSGSVDSTTRASSTGCNDFSTREFEDLPFLVDSAGESHWQATDHWKKTHDTARAVVMPLQKVHAPLVELGVVVGSNLTRQREVFRLHPQQLSLVIPCKETRSLLRRQVTRLIHGRHLRRQREIC